ncbi:MAG: dihydrodipicolinate synthase family protein [Rhodobacteraceae bacterium]|nr:dihydrodipicolinate synthase family protein [Paracoccaceae bacterium]
MPQSAPPPALPPGIHPMLYALFGADGALDRAAMRAQVEGALAAGVQGVAVLGLGTEVGKLSARERRMVLEWAAEDLAGRLPLTVTLAEPDLAAARAALKAAEAAGAACVIVQPPSEGARSESALAAFFGALADAAAVPLGIQNAPDYLGVGLGLETIARLVEDHPNLRLLKAEGPALYAAELVAATGGRVQVFNGRCGLELTDNLRAGCAGLIPALDCADVQARAAALMRTGLAEDADEADRLYAAVLPMTVFVIQSLPGFLTYGKRITARRLGLPPVVDRPPFLAPTAHGLAWAERYAAALPPLLPR